VSGQDTDWKTIKAEYIATSISYRNLSKKYGVPFRTLSDRAIREGWRNARSVTRNKTVTKTIEKTIEKISEAQSDIICKELEAAELITALVLETLKDPDQFKKHLITKKEGYGDGVSSQWVETAQFDVVDTKRLQALSDTLVKNTVLKRLIQGVVDAKDEQRLAIERQKLELAKETAGKDDPTNDGVSIVFESADVEEAGG
jgi:hypothetical protein